MRKPLAILPTLMLLLHAQTCVSCHPKEAEYLRHTRHFTLKNAINITRKTWGIVDSNVTLQSLPEPPRTIRKVSDLVDDFLRRKWLRCHLSQDPNRACLACHASHPPKGAYRQAKAKMSKCLVCHNKEYVGTDYLGWFPKDFDKSYRAPLSPKGFFPPQYFGIDYHHLSKDIHFKAGLTCIDCHTTLHGKTETKSCKSCHSRLDRSTHPRYHSRIDCIACHAAWQINSYELSLLRDDTPNYKQWKRLIVQEDPWLSRFLKKAFHAHQTPDPVMPDFVDGALHPGIWYSGYRYRRWEDFYLAVDSRDDKIKLYRPLYQYRISYKNAKGEMILDDVHRIGGKKIAVWLPYYPHTIGKRAKTCEMCHNNPLLLKKRKTGTVIDLKIPSDDSRIDHGRSLSTKERARLRSKRYKKVRADMLLKAWEETPSPKR